MWCGCDIINLTGRDCLEEKTKDTSCREERLIVSIESGVGGPSHQARMGVVWEQQKVQEKLCPESQDGDSKQWH